MFYGTEWDMRVPDLYTTMDGYSWMQCTYGRLFGNVFSGLSLLLVLLMSDTLARPQLS